MEKMMREEGYPRSRRTPSFSSTLLDAIYRSIDESKSNLDEEPQLGLFFNETTRQKQSSSNSTQFAEKNCNNKEKMKMNLRRAVMIEDWMEKQSSQSSQSSLFTNSASSCSESTSGTETRTTHKSRPKPEKKQQQQQQQKQKLKREGGGGGGGGGGFARTKLRALKIYGELNQRVLKQPISPASRIASFLSSIFNTGNVKKAKMCYAGAAKDVDFDHKSKSPCFSSSASSFSRRSCMTKTPTCSSSSSAKGKRTVRFYPVSVILGEDSYTHQNDPSLLPLSSVRKMTGVSSVKEVKKNSVKVKENGFVMKGYQNSCKNNQFDFRGSYDNGGDDEDEDEDEDDDALSCSSSDLFELDHIIGGGRYQEELPVYETTNLERNKAIAFVNYTTTHCN